MNTMREYSINIFVIILIMVLASFVASPFVYADDSNRYRDDALSVFSPGYLNAAKYQAEAIVKQQTQSKNFLQNMIDYVQNKTANKIENADSEKTQNKPVLQQKVSSSKGRSSNVQAVATMVMNGTSGSDNTAISPYITNKVREYLNAAGAGGLLISLKLQMGNIILPADGTDATSTYAKFQIFNQDGTALLNAPVILSSMNIPEGASPIPGINPDWYDLYNAIHSVDSITTLANGDIAISWTEQRGWENRTMEVQTFDASGNAVTAPITVTSYYKGSTLMYNASNPKYGEIVLLWAENDDSGNFSTLKTESFDAQGNALSTPITLIGGTSPACLESATILANGNLAVAWEETDQYGNGSLKAQVFDVNGNAVLSAPTTIYSDGGGWVSGGIDNMTVLSNGNIAVFGEAQDQYNNSYLGVVILDGNGKMISSAPTILDNVDGGGVNDVISLANGNTAVFYGGLNGSICAQILDANGNAILSSPITLAENTNWGTHIDNITTLSNGNIAVFWNNNDPDTSLRAQDLRFKR